MNGLSEVLARDLMNKRLFTARPDQKLGELEHELVDHNITGMPVVEKDRLLGVVSRSDITRATVLAQLLDGQIADELHWDETQADGFKHGDGEEFEGFQSRLQRLRVRDVMRQAVTCAPTAKAPELAKLMVQHHSHRVIVVEGDRVVGIISSLDLARAIADSK